MPDAHASLILPQFVPQPNEWQIARGDDESWNGSNGKVTMTVSPDGQPIRMFKRVFETVPLGSGADPLKLGREVWLVGEFEGVRCYVRDLFGEVGIVMTRRDLYKG